jgi:YHS domain-containing protein
MSALKSIVAGVLVAAFLAAPLSTLGVDSSTDKDTTKKVQKAKPYPLKTCIVSGEKLGGDMGDPYVFTYQGQEFKLCCKDCKKDFDKEPAKFTKKLAAAEKKTDKTTMK